MFPEKVKESVVKVAAIQVAIVAILSLFFKPIILFVLADFIFRAFIGPEYSFLAISAKFISNRLNMKGEMIKYAPKRFAAMIGFAITFAASIFILVSSPAFYVLVGMLILFSLLEGVFGFCVGCKLYWLMNKLVK